MPKPFKISKYVFYILIFSIVLTIPILILQQVAPAYASPALPYIVLFFFFLTLFTLYVVLRDESQRESRKFVSGYLISRMVKFFSCLLFFFLYVILNKEDKWNFAVAFLILYFLYAICELFVIKKENERLSKK